MFVSDDYYANLFYVNRNGMEVAVTYFRAGYDPRHYPTEKVCHWVWIKFDSLFSCSSDFSLQRLLWATSCSREGKTEVAHYLLIFLVHLLFFDCIGKAIDTWEFDHCSRTLPHLITFIITLSFILHSFDNGIHLVYTWLAFVLAFA